MVRCAFAKKMAAKLFSIRELDLVEPIGQKIEKDGSRQWS